MAPKIADYPEETVSLAIQAFLSVISFPIQGLTIELFSKAKERTLGSDARLGSHIMGISPFYMQFKRPSAWEQTANSKIIRHRKSAGFDTEPFTLFFDLRRKKPNQHDFQHNILFKLRRRLTQRSLGDAAYICPLFLDRQAYIFHMHGASISRWFQWWIPRPWRSASQQILTDSGHFNFDNLPVFHEHVTVPPHKLVHDANHSYSFTPDGEQVCFHSPEFLENSSLRFSAWLHSLFSNVVIRRGYPLITSENATDELKGLISSLELNLETIFPDGEIEAGDFNAWLHFGDYLSRLYGIEQYAFVHWKGEV